MTTSQHHRHVISLLLFLMLPTWTLSEAMTNNVSGPRDNSLTSYGSKSTSAAGKDRKSDWNAGTVVGESTADRTESFVVAWTPACHNDSCTSPELDPVDGESLRAVQQADRHPAAGDIERQDDVVDLMRSVSEELSGLRSALQQLRVDSQAVHRQIKRLHRASCTATRRARRRTKWTGSSEKNRRLPDTAEDKEQRRVIVARQHHHRHRYGANRCPAGFIYSPATSTCYLLRAEQVTWYAADRHCRRLGARLLAVRSAVEQRQLSELARTNSETAHCDFWIGLRRSRGSKTGGSRAGGRSQWGWTTVEADDGRQQRSTTSNSVVYGHWNTGEPNDAGGDEDCAQAMWMFSWRWNDAPCRSSLACYACQTSPTL